MLTPTEQLEQFKGEVHEILADTDGSFRGDQVAENAIVASATHLVYELTKHIDRALPTITSIEQTSQGERGKGKIEVTKDVRRAIKAVRNA